MTAKPKTLVLRAPGTNCDVETGHAFELAGSGVEAIHINQLMDRPALLEQFQILCLPGGFSYGDDVAAGRVLASQLTSRLADAMQEFKAADKLILGICNGFQILLKAGLLVPPGETGATPATLTWNDTGRFVDCWVNLLCNDSKCVFLKNVNQMYLPIAHAEGKFVVKEADLIDALLAADQVALKYCLPDGRNGQVPFPHNPNGSQGNVAGICDESGRVFGLMPHPERHLFPTHHPRWTRHEGKLPEHGEGFAVFQNAVDYFRS